MRTTPTSGGHNQSVRMDPEVVIRFLDDLSTKVDAVSHSTAELKAEVSAIKIRLFNGLTDTMRETYAKVLLLDNKQHETESRVLEIQRLWTEQFSSHETRDRLFHFVVGFFMSLMLVMVSLLAVYQIENRDIAALFADMEARRFSHLLPFEPSWGFVGP